MKFRTLCELARHFSYFLVWHRTFDEWIFTASPTSRRSALRLKTMHRLSSPPSRIRLRSPLLLCIVSYVDIHFRAEWMEKKEKNLLSPHSVCSPPYSIQSFVRFASEGEREENIHTGNVLLTERSKKKRRVREWREEGQKKGGKKLFCVLAMLLRFVRRLIGAEQSSSPVKTKGPKNNIREYISESNETMNEQREKRTDPKRRLVV